MKTNTQKFLNLLQLVKQYRKDNETSLTRLYNNFVNEGFSVDDEIIIKKVNKPLKPLDLKNILENSNAKNLNFITLNKNKDSHNNIYYCFYCFNYNLSNETIKENNFLNFTSYSFKTNAQLRKEAIFTILIYQNNKYIEAMNEKKTARHNANDTNYTRDRFILTKDFFNEYSAPADQQRYKYYKKDFYKNILIDNLIIKNLYNFKIHNYRFYSYNETALQIDRSGYILTYKRDQLKREAQALKEKRINENFKNNLRDDYIINLTHIKNTLENEIKTAYKKAVDSNNLNNIIILNRLYFDRFKNTFEKLDRYINKLKNNDFSKGWLNNSIVEFENTLKELNNTNFNNILKEYNIFLNFEVLDDEIEKEKGSYSNYNNWLESNGIKYPCCVNNYNAKIHKIENNKLLFLGYEKTLKNYFEFMEA